MNYKIITDEPKLLEFIDWLPELEAEECFYVSLFARKKYHASAKNDKCNCKRFTATDKTWLLKKIKQLEIPVGNYFNKDGTPVHNDALALYISINPRSFKAAQKKLLIRLAETITGADTHLNPSSLALSCIQKSKSRTVFVDFDFDDLEYSESEFKHILNRNAYSILKTRGGFHMLVQPSKVNIRFTLTWYRDLDFLKACDISGDNLIPVAGCTQGGFTPYLVEREL